MILQSLVKYYEILAKDLDSGIPMRGFSQAPVSFAANLSEQGELLNLIPLMVSVPRGKKMAEVPQKLMVPEQVKKSSGIRSNFLCENAGYLLGLDTKGNPEKAKKSFDAFCALHRQILSEVDCLGATAVLSFLDTWKPETAPEHPAVVPYLKELMAGANLVFRCSGEYVQDQQAVQEAWLNYKKEDAGGEMMRCLVTGELAPAAVLHPSLKGIKDGQSSGVSLVSFNASAYCSYGRDGQQGLNAPVSESAAFAYTTVLNYLLADEKHRMYLGDMTVVYYAYSNDSRYRDLMLNLFDPQEETQDSQEQHQDRKTEATAHAVFEKLKEGKPVEEALIEQGMDPNVKLFVLGLSPNAARASVRFFAENTFGKMIDNLMQHYRNLRIERQFDTDPKMIPIWMMLNETVSPNAKDKKANPLMAGAVLRAIMTGGRYPENLYQEILLRVKTDHNINYVKAAVIKAYLIKNYEINKNEEALTMSLNEKNKNKGYVLGRMFAVLEWIQASASPSINTTIRDQYFGAACATPALVFPKLIDLAQHHLAKLKEKKGYYMKSIEDLYELLWFEEEGLPAHLSMKDQGLFQAGYYQQRKKIYTKKEEK